jgi:hypothetical protein
MNEAKLAAVKLRLWTGEKGIYSKLFDSPTTMRLNSDWLFFDFEGLKSDPTLETAMSIVTAVADHPPPRAVIGAVALPLRVRLVRWWRPPETGDMIG